MVCPTRLEKLWPRQNTYEALAYNHSHTTSAFLPVFQKRGIVQDETEEQEKTHWQFDICGTRRQEICQRNSIALTEFQFLQSLRLVSPILFPGGKLLCTEVPWGFCGLRIVLQKQYKLCFIYKYAGMFSCTGSKLQQIRFPSEFRIS